MVQTLREGLWSPEKKWDHPGLSVTERRAFQDGAPEHPGSQRSQTWRGCKRAEKAWCFSFLQVNDLWCLTLPALSASIINHFNSCSFMIVFNIRWSKPLSLVFIIFLASLLCPFFFMVIFMASLVCLFF